MRRNVCMLVHVIVLPLLIIASSSMVVSSEEPIYGSGDWVHYEYVVRTENESCVWIIRYTIRKVNTTHVSYSGGLEGLVSGTVIDMPPTIGLTLVILPITE